VQLFHRNILVEAFKLPLWGHVADEVPPPWLVRGLQSEELVINRLGGLTMNTPHGVQSCTAGDIIVLFADGSLGFETPETLERDFEPVAVEELQHAA
jgi:hypothetical protein